MKHSQAQKLDWTRRFLNRPGWLCLLLLAVPLGGWGQSDDSAPAALPESAVIEPVLVPPEAVEFAAVAALAEAVAASATRTQALLTLATLTTLRDVAPASGPDAAARQLDTLRSHREWLEQLRTRYAPPLIRSPLMDAAAWQLQVQLDRVGLPATTLTTPLGPGQAPLRRQLFDRQHPALAASALPQLLWYLDASATVEWQGLKVRLANDPWLAAQLAQELPEWFAWPAATARVAEGENDAVAVEDQVLAAAMDSLAVSLRQVVSVGPPDPARLYRLRRDLLLALPDLDAGRRAHAAGLLQLASLIDGLYRDEYLPFASGLVALVAGLQGDAPFYPAQTRWFAAWLSEQLPLLSERFGRAFSTVDPRVNSVLAISFDALQTLSKETSEAQLAELRLVLADAVAALTLLIPDIGFYFDQPVRDPIAGSLDACTAIAGSLDADGTPAMTRQLFDDCQETLLELASFESRTAQLAGSASGPYGASNLRRELRLTTAQRVNYVLGWIDDRLVTACELPERPLPNPLEWAYLANFMAWFAEQSPVFFQTPENEQRLQRMLAVGRELTEGVTGQLDCLVGAGETLNDPVYRVSTDYELRLRELGRGLEEARRDWRSERLAVGADVRLEGQPRQATAYRPEALTIGPCDSQNVCEMNGSLSATRALFGLFDEAFLIADQTGFGALEICYDRMEWVDRRSEPVRPGDENVANYYGRLAFDLRGRFRQDAETSDLFAFRFTAPEESHYLFAMASEEVLEDPCPVEWIGERIVTELPAGRSRIVPNRLTYLTAARAQPSRLLASHWEQGEEWRDWFVTGLGVTPLEVPAPPAIDGPLNQHLQALYREEQRSLLGEMQPSAEPGNDEGLPRAMAEVDIGKLLLRSQLMLFYPDLLAREDGLREAVAGQQGLLDIRQVQRGAQRAEPADQLLETSFVRLEQFLAEWQTLPPAVRQQGAPSDSVTHALLRLEEVRTRFFDAPPSVPVRPLPAGLAGTDEQGVEEGQAEQ